MHCMQIQDANGPQTLQAVRLSFIPLLEAIADYTNSFELGGEKKTKGAALTFVSFTSPLDIDVLNVLGIGIVNIYCMTPWAWPLFF
jgi:hypothetical protein